MGFWTRKINLLSKNKNETLYKYKMNSFLILIFKKTLRNQNISKTDKK